MAWTRGTSVFHSSAVTHRLFSLQRLRHNTTTALTRSRGGGCCGTVLFSPPTSPHTIQHVPDVIHHSRQLTRLNCNTTDPWTTTWNSCVSFFAVSNAFDQIQRTPLLRRRRHGTVSNAPSSRLTHEEKDAVEQFCLHPTHRRLCEV